MTKFGKHQDKDVIDLASDEVFFFQAEDGIRDRTVTGVQTCALPICKGHRRSDPRACAAARRSRPLASSSCAEGEHGVAQALHEALTLAASTQACGSSPAGERGGRSEERRVGKECGCGFMGELHTD